jgi:hypothetical protein
MTLPFNKFMKNMTSLPSLPDEMTLGELGERLGISNMEDIVDAEREQTIMSDTSGAETETLYLRPEILKYEDGTPVPGRAFELLIDINSARTKPTLGISFRETSEGRFRISGISTTRHETLDQMQLPTLGNPIIDNVAALIWNHAHKSPAPPARKPKDPS